MTANIASVALLWPAWCFCCTWGCGAKHPSARVLSWIAVVPTVGLGYLLGTIGMLAVAFIVGDMVSAPLPGQSFETPDLACETTEWGGPGAGSGSTAVLYRKLPVVPWLRFRLTESTADYLAGVQGESCADLAARQ